VRFTPDVAAHCERVLTLVPRALGPRLGGQVQQVIRAVKAGDWSTSDGAVVAGGVTLLDGEYDLRLVAADVERSAPLPGGEGVVVLDVAVTPELAAEGLARDLVRVVQMARRDAGLDVSDRITVAVQAPAEVVAAAEANRAFVTGETLAERVTFGAEADVSAVGSGFTGEVGDGVPVRVAVAKI
jgi:isoleucyl-tRNA synthetase